MTPSLRRWVFLAGASGDVSVAVYATIDFIKVLPQAGMARVGGSNFPKRPGRCWGFFQMSPSR